MAISNIISPVPNNQPLADQKGNVTTVWSGFFNQLWLRTGGSQASSNTELQTQINDFVVSAPNSIKGNNTGTAIEALDLSPTQVTAMLNLFSSTLKGLVPLSGGGSLNFLRADGVWAPPAALESFKSAQVTTLSTSVTSSTFTTFSNSPALSFTPVYGGKYRVYCSVPAQINDPSFAKAAVRIINTGGGTLLAESRAMLSGATSLDPMEASILCQSEYTLVAGTSYIFDIQGSLISGTSLLNNGVNSPFYMFAERIG